MDYVGGCTFCYALLYLCDSPEQTKTLHFQLKRKFKNETHILNEDFMDPLQKLFELDLLHTYGIIMLFVIHC